MRWTAGLLVIGLVAGCGGDDSNDGARQPTDSTDTSSTAATGPDNPLAGQDDTAIRIEYSYKGGRSTMVYAADDAGVSLRSENDFNFRPSDGYPVTCEDEEGDGFQCYSYDPSTVLGVSLLLIRYLEAASADPGEPIGEVEATTIAGRSAECMAVEPSAALVNAAQAFEGMGATSGETRVCFDEASGFLLSWSIPFGTGDPGDLIELVAVTVSDPSAEDFEPPAFVFDGTDIDDDDIEFPDETIGM